jgi:hypothetical protein
MNAKLLKKIAQAHGLLDCAEGLIPPGLLGHFRAVLKSMEGCDCNECTRQYERHLAEVEYHFKECVTSRDNATRAMMDILRLKKPTDMKWESLPFSFLLPDFEEYCRNHRVTSGKTRSSD